MNLDGKVAVVTGAGRGLGLAYARALAAAGAKVVLNDIDTTSAESAAKEINATIATQPNTHTTDPPAATTGGAGAGGAVARASAGGTDAASAGKIGAGAGDAGAGGAVARGGADRTDAAGSGKVGADAGGVNAGGAGTHHEVTHGAHREVAHGAGASGAAGVGEVRCVAQAGAVGSAETAQALVDRAVAEFGRLDILVTNAGILRDRVLWKMSDDDFDAVIDVHLRGTFTCVRAAVQQLREQGDGGRIILAGSPAGQRGNFGQTNYAAAKAGIAAMARTWAMELARANITVNAVIPNAATEMTKTIPAFAPYIESGTFPDSLRKGVGFGTPEDCAGLVVYLASDAAAEVTGQCVGIGGDKLTLWSHPQEISAAYADGGWTADAIADAWPTSVGSRLETYGIPG